MKLFLDIAATLYEAKSFYDVGKIILSILQKLASDQIISGKIGIYDKVIDEYKIYYISDEKVESNIRDYEKEVYKIINTPCKFSEIKYFSRIVADTKNKLIIQNNHSKESLKIHSAQKQFEPHAMMWVPLVYNDDFLGIISLASKPINSFTDEIVQSIEGIAKLTSIKVCELFASNKLIKSEEKFRSLYENVTIGLYRTTPDGIIILANPSLIKMLGYSSFDELSNRNLEKVGFEPEYSRNQFKKRLEKDGEIRGIEAVWTKKDGTTIYVRESARVILNINGTVQYYEGTIENITDRKQIEENLKESLLKWQTTFDTIKDSIFLLDNNGVIKQVNKSTTKLLEKTETEILGRPCWEIVHCSSGHIEGCPFVRMKKTKKRESMLLQVDSKWFEVIVDPMLDDKSNLHGAVHIITDITEQKKAEIKLYESEQKFKSIFSQSPIGQELYDYEGKLVDVNPACLAIFGIESVEEVIGFNLFDDPNIPSDAKEKLLLGESVRFETCFDFDSVKRMSLYKTNKAGLCYLDCSITKWIFHENTKSGFLVHVIDITEQMNSEMNRRENEKRLKKAENIGKLGNYEINLITGDIIWSDQVYKVFGFERTDFVPNSKNYIDLIHPDDVSKVNESIDVQLKRFGSFDIEYRTITKQGKTKWVRSTSEVKFDENQNASKLFGIIQDVTDRKQSEIALFEATENLKATMNAIPDIMFEVNNKGKIYSYHAPEHDLLYTSPENFLGKNFSDVLPEDVANIILQSLSDASQIGWHRGSSYSLVLPTGKHWFELSIAKKRESQPENERFIVLVRNITERKHVEEVLESSEKKYREIVNSLPNAIVIYIDGKVVFANNATIQLMRATNVEEILGKPVIDFVHPDYKEFVKQRINKASKTEKPLPFAEEKFIGFDGTVVDVEVKAIPITFEKKPAVQIVILDITERKQIEEDRIKLQNLESLGVLAGGIAHDYNNLLTSIMGNASLARLNIRDQEFTQKIMD